MSKLRPIHNGFSLTETVIALGLFAFCILPIIGLIPVGMGAARSVKQEAQAADLAEAFFGAWQVKPANNSATEFPIPSMFTNPAVPLKSTPKSVMYFDGDGAQVDSVAAAAMKLVYDVNTDASTKTVTIKLDFSWPPTDGPAAQKRSFVRVLPGS